jgi:hypothetical protein
MAFPHNTRVALEGAGLPTLAEARLNLDNRRKNLADIIVLATLQQREHLARGEAREAPTTGTPPHLLFLDIPGREYAVRVAAQVVLDVERVMNMTAS